MMAHPHGPLVSTGTEHVFLPLNLLFTIISYLDDPADLARACRTCRVFHYMCLPKLYTNVILRSYDHIRYSEETAAPEGMGGASPFAMGLNALVLGNVSQYVQRLELTGNLQEYGLEESAMAGRVPDGGMMLGLLVRTCLDRMPQLKSFSWTLKSKMLPTVWQGLGSKEALTSLTVCMPTTRHPAPTVIAPAIPNLRYLHVTDIDPACYPDNISELLYHSRKLEHLKLHFSPRMRLEREPSINLDSFFGKVKTSDYRMQLKSLALQNLYAGNGGNYADMYNPSLMESITLIDSSGGADNDAAMSFVTHFPIKMPPLTNVRLLRGNKASPRHAQTLRSILKSLNTYYLITGRPFKDIPLAASPSNRNGSVSQMSTPRSPNEPPSMTSTPRSQPEASVSSSGRRSSSIAVGDKASRADMAVANLLPHYIDSICADPRPLLHNMLLFPQWKLTTEHLTRLVRNCPYFQELGMAIEPPALDVIHYLASHLSKLRALRLFNAPDPLDLGEDMAAVTEWYEIRIGAAAWNKKHSALRWVGVGDLYFEIIPGADIEVDIDGDRRRARTVRRIPLSRIKDVGIWATDVLEI